MNEDEVESVERLIGEVEALQAIYGTNLTICSETSLQESRDALLHRCRMPQHSVEINLQVDTDTGGSGKLRLHCTLPPGYPGLQCAQVYLSSSSSSDGQVLSRSVLDTLSTSLREKAQELVGSEVVMELVQHLQEQLAELELKRQQAQPQPKPVPNNKPKTPLLGRRWIWAHHIKDTTRRKSIVQEAQNANLGGYLKPGYPGIVVIEGEIQKCEEFVEWIKGSKSRPGGFGRNWGHHVKGEIALEDGSRLLPLQFQELEESMKELGGLCKEHGLEEEFREFVLQHKGTTN